MTLPDVITRIGIAAALAVGGTSHAYLYIHGYRHIPTIGTAFIVQASVSFALAALVLLGGPAWLQWAAAMLAGGSLVAFALSRTVGLFGFIENGWEPSPYTWLTVCAEALTILLVGAALIPRKLRSSAAVRS